MNTRTAAIRKTTTNDAVEVAEILDAGDIANAQKSFLDFRVVMHPDMAMHIEGCTSSVPWFVRDLSEELQRFYEDLIAGRRPKLGIMAPPQHGKSYAVEDFIAWLAGKQQ